MWLVSRADAGSLASTDPLTQQEFEDTKRKIEDYAHNNSVQSSLEIPYLPRFLGPAFSIFKSLVQKAFIKQDEEHETKQNTVSQNTITHLNAQVRQTSPARIFCREE